MSIKTTLFVDDLEFRVLDHSLGFFQNSDYAGCPNSKPKAYPFRFTVEASKDTTFCEWAVDSAMQKKHVKIVFSPSSGMSKSTTIELLDVYCIRCIYDFKATGSRPFTVNFDLSPGIIMRNGVVLLKRSWAVSDPELLSQPVEEQKQSEEEKIKKDVLVEPTYFIVGTNIIASIKRSDNLPIGNGKTIEIGSFHIDNYWVDNDGVVYFIPPKTQIYFQTNEAVIGGDLFNIGNDIRTVSNPKESIKSLQDQLNILHKLADLTTKNNIKFPKSVKDQLIKEGYHRFRLALNDLENKFSNPELNKILSNEICKAF